MAEKKLFKYKKDGESMTLKTQNESQELVE